MDRALDGVVELVWSALGVACIAHHALVPAFICAFLLLSGAHVRAPPCDEAIKLIGARGVAIDSAEEGATPPWNSHAVQWSARLSTYADVARAPAGGSYACPLAGALLSDSTIALTRLI